VKWQIWFDLISTKIFWIFLVIVLLFIFPKISYLPILWQWFKKQLPFMILFLGLRDWLKNY
jgi:hypothetical protein